MKEALCFTGSRMVDESFVPATLESVRRCPARSDFIELCFATDEGAWTWCFRDPPEGNGCGSVGALALAVGPYGPQARSVDDDGIGVALPTSEALPMILGDSPTFVARRLVERGW
jgi:hypothetical protein